MSVFGDASSATVQMLTLEPCGTRTKRSTRPATWAAARATRTVTLKLLVIAAGAVALMSCTSKPPQEPAIGVAYVGPASLVLRTDLTVRSPERITVSHGDRLDILETRRRFVRVRPAEGTEGWPGA